MTLFQEGNTVSNNKLIFPVALTSSLKFWKYLVSQSKFYLPREHQISPYIEEEQTTPKEMYTIQVVLLSEEETRIEVTVSHLARDNGNLYMGS